MQFIEAVDDEAHGGRKPARPEPETVLHVFYNAPLPSIQHHIFGCRFGLPFHTTIPNKGYLLALMGLYIYCAVIVNSKISSHNCKSHKCNISLHMDIPGFVDWFQNELKIRDWSQADFSRHSGISGSQVSRVYSGLYPPGKKFMERTAATFNVPLDEVWRAAGLVEPEPDTDPIVERINYILNHLPEEDRDYILTLVEALQRKHEQEQRRPKSRG